MKIQLKGLDIKQPEIEDSQKITSQIQHRLDSVFKDAHVRLYEDGNYAILFKKGDYITKNWLYDYKTEQITLIGHTPDEEYVLKKIDSGDEWMQVELMGKRRSRLSPISFSGIKVYLLFSEDPKYEHEDEDLLSPHKNQWRQQPAKKQSNEQIKARVIEHLSYMIDYFKLIEKKEQGYFEPSLLQSPLQFYNHGLGLSAINDLPKRWVNTFYDYSDAITAYHMLTDAIQSSGDYPKGKTFVEEYRKVIEKMRLYLER